MKHKIGARLGAFEQQTSNLRCLRHTTTSNNLLYMLKTSFKSFYYIFCSKLILDLIYIFLGRLSMSLGGPPARSRWLGPKRADKIDGWAQKGRTKSLVKKDGRRGSNRDLRERGLAPYHYTTRSFLFCGGRSRFI